MRLFGTLAQCSLGLLKNRLRFRLANPEVMAKGVMVLEWPDRTARVEFQALGKEIKKIFGEKG